MSSHFILAEDMHSRLQRAQEALAFVADVVGLLEVRSAAANKAAGLPHTLTKNAEIHAAGMAEFCSLIGDELAAVLNGARLHCEGGAAHG